MSENGNQNDLNQLVNKSSDKARKAAEKSQLIERQNSEMKRLLRLLPFQVFVLVAGADDNIDPAEVSGFKEFLNQRKKRVSNQYTLRMFHATVVNYTALTNRFYQGQIKQEFDNIEKVVKYMQLCVSQEMMTKICDDLMELAKAIAEASGGFLGMTSPINKQEQAVLDKLDSIFLEGIQNAGKQKTHENWLADL